MNGAARPRRRLPLPLGLALVFGSVAVIVGVFLERQRVEVIGRTGEIAAMHARAVEGFLTHGVETAAIVAGGLTPEADGTVANGDLLRGLPLVRSVSFVDADGRVIASTNPRNLGVTVALADFYPQVDGSDPLALGPPWRGRDLASGAPIRAETEVGDRDLGFLPLIAAAQRAEPGVRVLISLNSDFLQTHFAQNLPPEAGRIDILRYDDLRLVSSDPHERPGSLDTAVRGSFDLTKAEFGPLPDPTGTWIGHVHASPSLPLAVVTRIDRDRALSAWRDAALTLVGVLSLAGASIAVLATVFIRRRDLFNAQRHALERLRRINAACVFANAREAIVITDADGVITDVNDSFHRLTGHPRDTAVGRRIDILRSGRHGPAFWLGVRRQLRTAGFWQGEIRLGHRDGHAFVAQQTISAVGDDDGRIRQYVAMFSDVTEAREQAERLERAAHYDALTGLPNRTLLARRLEQAMVEARSTGRSLAVVFIDVDGFKAVNDTFGHACGDDLLVAIGLRLSAELGPADVLGRLGGDEFVAVLCDEHEGPDCTAQLDRLLAAVAAPIVLQGHEVSVGASLGVSFFPQGTDDAEVDADQLLRRADQAMYRAKISGKNRHSVFDAERDRSERAYHETLANLREAFESERFVLHYQPAVSLADGRPKGLEALIRWRDPARGLIQPTRFVPLLENNPIALPIGEWVIDRALGELDRWLAAGLDLYLSVNVSGVHLQSDGFAKRLAAILDRHAEASRNRLVIEIPEAVAFSDLDRIGAAIAGCRRLGVRFALDDFGTGYSSLAYLERLPFDVLKIDRSFVADIGRCDRSTVVLEAIVDLSTKLGHATVAEGIETEEQWDVLRRLGCGWGQGFLFAPPMPADEVIAWASARSAVAAASERSRLVQPATT